MIHFVSSPSCSCDSIIKHNANNWKISLAYHFSTPMTPFSALMTSFPDNCVKRVQIRSIFLVCIFLYLEWIRRFTKYSLQIWTLFTPYLDTFLAVIAIINEYSTGCIHEEAISEADIGDIVEPRNPRPCFFFRILLFQ